MLSLTHRYVDADTGADMSAPAVLISRERFLGLLEIERRAWEFLTADAEAAYGMGSDAAEEWGALAEVVEAQGNPP